MKRILLGVAAVAAMTFVPHTASAQDGAELTLVHGLTGSTVDVSVDGTVVIDDFAPGSLANISSFAGQTLANVAITDDASGTVLIGPIAQLEIPATGNWSIVAHLDADGNALISSFENNTAEVAAGSARLTVRHVAAAPAVDVVLGTIRPITNAVNGDSEEVDFPVGDLAGAELAPTGEAGIATIPTTNLAADTNTIIYATGSVDDDTLGFILQVINIAAGTDASTTTVAGDTTESSTTTTAAAPSAVNTGSPLESSSNLAVIAVALGGLALAGGALVTRRRV